METYKITHPATNKVVNLYIGSQTGPVPNGARLSLYSWQNNNDQKWQLEYVDGSKLLRLARDTSKVMNRNSKNNNAHVWYYDGTAATKNDSLIQTETTGGHTRIKLVNRGLYLTKNMNDSFLSWAGKTDSSRQYFEMEAVSGGGGGSKKLSLPLASYSHISQPFGNGHLGIDYAAPIGTTIKAAADGRMIFKRTFNANNPNLPSSSWDTMGNCVYIQHPDFGMSLYMHMNAPCSLNVGTTVSRGQAIGAVGMSGNSGGAHLHFGFKLGSAFSYNNVNAYHEGTWVDPALYM